MAYYNRRKKRRQAEAARQAGPTPEQQLVAQQLEDLKKQRTEEELFRPEFYRSQGYTLDAATGQYRKMSEEERLAGMNPEEKSAYTIQSLANERTLKAMKGELAIDPAVEQDIASSEQTTRAELAAQLGTGYEVSTPGMKRLEEMKAKANALRSQLRHGEISMAEGLVSGRRGERADISGNYRSLSSPYERMGQEGNLLNRYAQERAAAQAAKEARRNRYAQIGGAAIGAGGMIAASSRELKENIKLVSEREDEELLERVISTPLSRYNYVPEVAEEIGDDGREHLGLIAEDAPAEVATHGRKAIDLYDMNAVLWASVRALSREVTKLRGLLEPVY